MSLALIQGYSSEEEAAGNDQLYLSTSDEDDDSDHKENHIVSATFSKPSFHAAKPPAAGSGSVLPSALDAFAEIEGPPQFLNSCVEENISGRDIDHGAARWSRGSSRRKHKEKKDIPVGAVMEAKPQLVGIHERVRSDIAGNVPPISSAAQPQKGSMSTTPGEGKRVATATNPSEEDAAELLRMCVHCGIPKTFSSGRGMVCPVCGDRPPVDPNKEPLKKKGSAIKEKEKNKRMKGQSSHATWKSETEMQLRQQFD